jgi:hypothetical protein
MPVVRNGNWKRNTDQATTEDIEENKTMTTNTPAMRADIDALYQVLEYACIDDGQGSLHLNRKSFDWAIENFVTIVQGANKPAQSPDLEQRAKAAADEINRIAAENGDLLGDGHLAAIILRHFIGAGEVNEKLVGALKDIVKDERCDNDGRGCPVLEQVEEVINNAAAQSCEGGKES